ncbi:MAG: DNA translocase FtsK 4TM domain-containing protein [bacterium]|nr:DNA translocase FtsK 4TM domain-containing protein [bacterium]
MGNAVRKRVPSIPRHDTGKKPKKKEMPPQRSLARESSAVVLFFLAVFVFFSLVSYLQLTPISSFLERVSVNSSNPVEGNMLGPVGEGLSSLLVELLGWCSFIVVFYTLVLARLVWTGGFKASDGSVISFVQAVLGAMALVVSCATISAVIFDFEGGGRIGSSVAYLLVGYVANLGALLIASLGVILSLGAGTGIGTTKVFSGISYLAGLLREFLVDSLSVFRGGLGRTASLFKLGDFFLLKAMFVFMLVLARWVKEKVAFLFSVPGRIFHLAVSLFHRIRPLKHEARLALDDRSWVLEEGSLNTSEDLIEDEDDDSDHVTGVFGAARQEGKREVDPNVKIVLSAKKRSFKGFSRSRGKQRFRSRVGKSHDSSPEKVFALPAFDLLDPSTEKDIVVHEKHDLLANSRTLEKALADFKIGGKVVEAQPGPVVTLYQFVPAAGVKAQRVIGLADDLALALKVASVRVYAPVPGKGTIGIEVPNPRSELVRLRDVLESEAYNGEESSLALAIGKDTFGNPCVEDLAHMPHLLIAGATGTGKSVCINSLLLSLLYRNTPAELRLLLIDPKMLELSVYEKIPHLKAPVVTNPKRARAVLYWAVEEMERRYGLMKDVGVRNLASYNKKIEDSREKGEASGRLETLPRIVVVVDELADLMLTVGREIEELLTRLAQKARASGIHLILATQRPSVNVITGLIKANFPSRISFQVATRIDARTVLDRGGAEKLLGRGDMLYVSPGLNRPRRLHGAFVSDQEVHNVVEALIAQGPADYDPEIDQVIEKLEQADNGSGGGNLDEYDPLYDQAVNLVVEKGQASTSLVQRNFRIGYNRAARILETMESEGVVGPADGAKPRQILAPRHGVGN